MKAVHPNRIMAACVALTLVLGIPGPTDEWSWSIRGCDRHDTHRATEADENTAVRYVDPSQIRNLRIEYSPGEASVIVVDDEKLDGKIVITETAPEGWHDTPHMAITTEGEELAVRYGDSPPKIALRSCSVSSGKSLEVALPKSCAEQLDVVSFDGSASDYKLTGVTCQTLQVNLSSGRFKAKKVAAQDIDVEVSSGEIDFDGKVSSSLKASASSGELCVRTREVPKEAQVSVSSGSLDLRLPRKAGFTAHVTVGSGSFDCDFETVERDGALVVGDGSMALDVSVESGEARIRKR